jgi:hypothetical protein
MRYLIFFITGFFISQQDNLNTHNTVLERLIVVFKLSYGVTLSRKKHTEQNLLVSLLTFTFYQRREIEYAGETMHNSLLVPKLSGNPGLFLTFFFTGRLRLNPPHLNINSTVETSLQRHAEFSQFISYVAWLDSSFLHCRRTSVRTGKQCCHSASQFLKLDVSQSRYLPISSSTQ